MDWQAIHILGQQCTLALNGIYSGFTDPIMRFFSNIPIWVPMYIIVAAALFLRLGWKKALIVIASIALTFLCCDQLSNLVKVSVARLRPCHDPYMIENGVRLLEKAGGAYGFFSGHAANSFGFAVSSYMGFRNDRRLKYRGYSYWIFFWCTMVSISRIFVGKHYIGDVIIGACIGAAVGFLFALAARYLISKMKAPCKGAFTNQQ